MGHLEGTAGCTWSIACSLEDTHLEGTAVCP